MSFIEKYGKQWCFLFILAADGSRRPEHREVVRENILRAIKECEECGDISNKKNVEAVLTLVNEVWGLRDYLQELVEKGVINE